MTLTNSALMPNVIPASLFDLSMRRPMTGDSNPANSPIINAMPSWPTVTSRPRAMTATKGGANL